MVKNPLANAGDTGYVGLISGSGKSSGEGNGNISSIISWRIPWTEEPGGLQSMGSQRVGHNRARTHAQFTNYHLKLPFILTTTV